MVFNYRAMGFDNPHTNDHTVVQELPERFNARPNAIIVANTALRRASSADLVRFISF